MDVPIVQRIAEAAIGALPKCLGEVGRLTRSESQTPSWLAREPSARIGDRRRGPFRKRPKRSAPPIAASGFSESPRRRAIPIAVIRMMPWIGIFARVASPVDRNHVEPVFDKAKLSFRLASRHLVGFRDTD